MISTITMSNYIFNTNTSVYGKLVYAAIKKYSNNKGVCFPSRNTLAQLCKISLSTLRKAINGLVDAKVLDKSYRYRENRSQTSNLYTLAPFMISGDYYFNVRADIFELGLTEIETVIYMYLCSCANKDNECYPSMSRIATACGVSQTSVKYAIRILCEKQLIIKSNQFREDGGKRNNLYKLTSESIDVIQDKIELLPEFENEDADGDYNDIIETEDSCADFIVEEGEHERIKIEEVPCESESLDVDIDESNSYEIEKKNAITNVKIRGDIFDFKLLQHSVMVQLYNVFKTDKFPTVRQVARNCNISKAEAIEALLELNSLGIIKTNDEPFSNPMVITEPPPWSILNSCHSH